MHIFELVEYLIYRNQQKNTLVQACVTLTISEIHDLVLLRIFFFN